MTTRRIERLYIYSSRLGLEAKMVSASNRRTGRVNDLGRILLVRPWGETRWVWCYSWRDWIAAVRLVLRRPRGGTL
jgi:hypothetical protein